MTDARSIGIVKGCGSDPLLQQLSDRVDALQQQVERIAEQQKRLSPKRSTRFAVPTEEELLSYCQEKGLSIDVNRFQDHYESNGWMVGKNKMKSWQAALRNASKWCGTASPTAAGGSHLRIQQQQLDKLRGSSNERSW